MREASSPLRDVSSSRIAFSFLPANFCPGSAISCHLPPLANQEGQPREESAVVATNANAPREGSKTSRVIEMLKHESGTTLEEIMAEMGWLKHTTRSMVSAGGSLAKKHGLIVISEKVGDLQSRIRQGEVAEQTGDRHVMPPLRIVPVHIGSRQV